MAVIAAHPQALHCNITAVEADLALGDAPPVADAASARRGPVRRCASSRSTCSMAPIPATRQKRSNELSTSCQAASRLGIGAIDEGVIMFVMALLSFADSTPRA